MSETANHIGNQAELHWELEESTEKDWKVTTIKCHGRLVAQTAPQIEELVKPLILAGGKILIDVIDLDYMDSMGLGALVSLKVSAINKGYCTLELVNLSPKVRQLLSITNLLQVLTSK